jgi:hypothetical protein
MRTRSFVFGLQSDDIISSSDGVRRSLWPSGTFSPASSIFSCTHASCDGSSYSWGVSSGVPTFPGGLPAVAPVFLGKLPGGAAMIPGGLPPALPTTPAVIPPPAVAPPTPTIPEGFPPAFPPFQAFVPPPGVVPPAPPVCDKLLKLYPIKDTKAFLDSFEQIQF